MLSFISPLNSVFRFVLILLALLSLEFQAAEQIPAQDAQSPYPRELQAVADQLSELFADHQFVFVGSTHGGMKIHELLLCLINRPRFQEHVTDIIVEFANASHQKLMDRFLLDLDAVSIDDLRPVWFDTSAPRLWATLPQVPEFFAAMRDVNQRLDKSKRIRVIGGNAPVEWSKVMSVHDLARYPFKTNFAAHVIAELLSPQRNRRVLVVYGDGHNYYNGGTLMSDIVGRVESDRLFVVGTIRALKRGERDLVAQFGNPDRPFFVHADKFPTAAALPGDVNYGKNKALSHFVDGVVYLGPVPDRSAPKRIKLTEKEIAILKDRSAISRHPQMLKLRYKNRENWFETNLIDR